jgi:hypothetical protein
VFAEGPHPAEAERKWEELAEDDTPGTWFWTDASRKEENTAVGIVRMEAGKFVERRGLRLQDGYPTHMAELYALGSAIKSVAGRRGMDINFATDSRMALDMLTKRRGGTAYAIHKELKRIEDEGSTLRLWWSSDQHRGIAEAARSRRGPEKSQRSFHKSEPPSRGGCSRRKRQRHPWRGGKPNGTKARQEG